MATLELLVFDMAGTTVEDNQDVYNTFMKTVAECDIEATGDEVREWMGRRKRDVFEYFVTRQEGEGAPGLDAKINEVYAHFRGCLEDHYRNDPVKAVEGAEDLFSKLRKGGIQVALTTGFYRTVTDIILGRLGWDKCLDENHVGGAGSIIDVSICADEVPQGRPAPDMIHKAMGLLGVLDVHVVGNVGDTKVDLLSAHHAGCGINVGVLSGACDAATLKEYPHTHIIDSVADVPEVVGSIS
ncbi:MAG: phosphonatase-like hydrolase [Planctomycetes bacterium]|nr:phosphonatase-like hydrolase [Planctomycetota bacterium]